MTTTYVKTTSAGVLETSLSLGEAAAMIDGFADSPVVSGSRVIAIDIGSDTVALNVAEIVEYSASPFADELNIGDAAQVTDQAATGEDDLQRRDQSSRGRRGGRR